jgi:hypothetical protein
MNEWISRKTPPKRDCACLVINDKGWMSNTRALYHVMYDVFTLCDPNYRVGLTLDVTHYLIIPEPPK